MRKLLFLLFLAAVETLSAQVSDPVIMTIAGQPVLRSEFEYSYNKNNSEGVIDKKTVAEYVPLFVNYKLKVQAALDAHMDTLTSFLNEFAMYRDQQVQPLLVTDDDMEAEALDIYNRTKNRIGPDGLVQTAHILIQVGQQASPEELAQAKERIDSVYKALKGGADFAELARQVSQDPGSAPNGGELPFVSRGQLVKEFEDVAFSLKDGEMSGIVQSPFGYHVILRKAAKQLEPFEFFHDDIFNFMEQRGVRDQIAARLVDSLAAKQGVQPAEVMAQAADSLSQTDPELKYLIQEYHDGLLLYEISNNLIWEKAAQDEAGLAQYFKRHKKNYAWSEPRYKGMAYHVKTPADVRAVRNCVKKLPFEQWGERLRTTFNGDSIIRIRVEKGLFRQGDNALIDSAIFRVDTTFTSLPEYPINAVYGKLLKKGPEDYTDVRGLVVADYQTELEQQWVEELRRKYAVEVDEEVLKTVNQH